MGYFEAVVFGLVVGVVLARFYYAKVIAFGQAVIGKGIKDIQTLVSKL